MTCKYKYKNVSLKNKTYSDLLEISNEMAPGEQLSPAKTIDNLVYFFKSLVPKTNKEATNDKITYTKTR